MARETKATCDKIVADIERERADLAATRVTLEADRAGAVKEREEAVAALKRAAEAEAEAEKARADADAKVADANARLAKAVADADAAGITSARLKEREDALADQKAEIERVLDELGPRETDCARREKRVSIDEERSACGPRNSPRSSPPRRDGSWTRRHGRRSTRR